MALKLKLDRRFVKFVILGLWNTTFGYLLFLALLQINVLEEQPNWALFLTYVISSVQTFVVQKKLVWNDKSDWKILAAPFVLANLCAYMLNQVLFHLGRTWLDLDPRIAQLFAIPFVVLVSYVLLNRLVFTRALPPSDRST